MLMYTYNNKKKKTQTNKKILFPHNQILETQHFTKDDRLHFGILQR